MLSPLLHSIQKGREVIAFFTCAMLTAVFSSIGFSGLFSGNRGKQLDSQPRGG